MYQLCCVIVLCCGFVLTTEGRVLCNDPNASPWKPLGYSCPVNCYNVRYAIERLKMNDYQNFISNDVIIREDDRTSIHLMTALRQNVTGRNTLFNDKLSGRKAFNFVKAGKSKYDKYKEFTRLLHNANIVSEIQAKLDEMSSYASRKCGRIVKRALLKPYVLNDVLNNCTRRSNVELDFMTGLTNILNKHSKQFKFNLDMTRILLQKILGSDMDLRNGVFDIHRILLYLKKAVDNTVHPLPDTHPLTFKLRSTHCLSAHVVGCFCKRGFVERSGRCVEPSSCLKDTTNVKYLPRITVY